MIWDVEVRDAGAKGLGVFARRPFRRGEFIFRRRHGRVVPNTESSRLSEAERRHLCEISLTEVAVLLPPGCFLNHACDPNAMRSGVKVFAWRDIADGDEITIDYRLNAHDDTEVWDCCCGSPSCTGRVVGSFFSLDDVRQAAYLPHAPGFIKSEFRRRRPPR